MCRVALIGENSVEFIRFLVDIWNNGDCAVLIDRQIPPRSAVEMMFEANVNKCYIEQKYYEKVFEVANNTIELVPYDRGNISAQLLPTDIYDDFRENYSGDEAVVIYSSGTTGNSKGIILSHFAIHTNADAIIDYMRPNSDDSMYIVKPLAHSSTITGELLVALKTRIPVLIAPIVVPPRYTLRNIKQYGITIIGVNPLLLMMYCEEYNRGVYDISCLKKLYVSGSILNDKIYAQAHSVFKNKEIYNVYGLSEAGPRVTAQRRDCCKSNSVGKAIKGVEVAVVDENGNVTAPGNNGIVHVKSPSILKGYVQGELKHKSLYCGWLNTGDIGYIDEFGELHIVGRLDNMIILDSRKIYPLKVEQQIQAVGNICECTVVMVNFKDNDILCCLYVSDEEIRGDIKSVLGATLAKCEIPKIFIRTDEIPKNRNGKVALNIVKEIALRDLQVGTDV